MPSKTTGHCRCGKIRFTVSGRPIITMACHCTGCQRMSASAFSLSSLYPASAFEITSGTPVIGGLHGAPRHFFCDFCKSWIFTRLPGIDDVVNVRAMMFNDAASYRPFVETYTIEKLPWAHTGAEHSFDRFPPEEAFPRLIQAFAARS